jgi:hypothetical protein
MQISLAAQVAVPQAAALSGDGVLLSPDLGGAPHAASKHANTRSFIARIVDDPERSSCTEIKQSAHQRSRSCAGAPVAIPGAMQSLRQQPLFAFDHECRKQIRETRVTLLEHLRSEPDDLRALVLADVIGELDPDRDLVLAEHRMRFRATRGEDWKLRAKELGLDRVLFHLAEGMRRAKIGRDAVPILERRAIEISEARAAATPRGLIDASYVPAALAARATFHASGHLSRVSVRVDRRHEGQLALAVAPGAGSFSITEVRGGYGTYVSERYRDGHVEITLNTPWHDGEQAREPKPWTRWVEECLTELARLAGRR